MKTILILAGLLFGSDLSVVQAQVVKNPLLDYFHGIKSGDYQGDSEPHYTPQTEIYYFAAGFTGKGHKSIFITDDENREGAHGDYSWSVYCPLPSGGYQKLEIGLSTSINGPAYIGYVAEIKGYGAVDSARDVVSVQYARKGGVAITFLGKNQEAEEEDYPQYFASPAKWNIQKCTLAELEQKYAKPDSASVIAPTAK